ncbi:pyocin knob domain-containing protein [Sutterella wadsworthensis]|uniref:pyocin knob domain-containing protein n=1 Tax=Sutterella wadsworthensis TaxID=40545 RepID=UPI00241C3E5E|nr:pyocin knob domain-containing protein [Sutterella wadsworthensis]
MQRYTEIPSSKALSESLSLILSNDKTGLSCSAGTAFPTVNVQQGMLCYRTDENKLYILTDPTEVVWKVVADASGDARNLDGGEGNAIDYEKRNLNDWVSMPTGFYEGSNMLNAPSGDTYWRVLQIRQGNSNGYSTQIAFGASSGKVCTRFQSGGQWSNWQDLYAGANGKVVANLNADKVDDKEPGNAAGNIAINNGTLNVSLNADKLDGYDAGNSSGLIPINNGVVNGGLNADMVDGKHAGNSADQIPINNGKLNVGLNAEMLGGLKSSDFLRVDSTSSVQTTLENLTVKNLKAATIASPKNYSASAQGYRDIGSTAISTTGATDTTDQTGSGKLSSVTTYLRTNPGVEAGTYDIYALLQKLASLSHSHSIHKRTTNYNCNCKCNCTSTSGDSDGF